MGSSKYLIYGLADPITQELRYIGKSSNGLNRPKEHWRKRDLYRLQDYCHRWVRKVLKETGKPPTILVLQICDKDSLNEEEIFYISYFKSIGANLTNITLGGDGCGRPTKKVIRNDGIVFNSVKEAAKSVGSNSGQLITAIKKGYRVKGFEYKYYTGVESAWSKNTYLKHAVRVMRSDGKIFNSVLEAADFMKVSASRISTSFVKGFKIMGYDFIRLGKARSYV